MPSLALSARLVQDTVLANESLEVIVSVKNSGNDAVEVHDPEIENPFRYELIRLDDSGRRFGFSEADAELAYNPQPHVQQAPKLKTLAPGQVFSYETDLARLMTEAVPPGDYHLVVHYRQGEQDLTTTPAPVTFSSPKTEGHANLVSKSKEILISTFIQDAGRQGRWLMQRESRPSHPGLGIIYRRQKLDAAPAATALASESGSDRPGGSWYAWLEGDQIGAGWGWGKSRMCSIGPVATGLSDVRLISSGLRLDGPHAMFLAAGLAADGQASVKAFAFAFVPQPPPSTSESGLPTLAPLKKEPQNAAPPEHNPETLTFDLGAPLPDRILARYIYQSDKKAIQLVWAQQEQGRTQIFLQTLHPAAPMTTAAPKLLLECNDRLAALSLEPIGESVSGVVDALFGPAGSDKTMTYTRIALDGDRPTEQWAFEARGMIPLSAEIETDPAVEQWAISAVPVREAPVLAKVKDRMVLIKAATPGGWDPVATDAGDADHLFLSALYVPDRFNGLLWGFWVDPGKGLIYQRLD